MLDLYTQDHLQSLDLDLENIDGLLSLKSAFSARDLPEARALVLQIDQELEYRGYPV